MFSRASTPSCEIKIVVTGGLGDCLLTTPFIRHFRNCETYKKITCVFPQGAKEIFDQNPNIDQLIPCEGEELFLWAAPERDSDIFSPYIQVSVPHKISAQMKISTDHYLKPNLSSQPVIQQVAQHHNIDLKDDSLELFTTESDENWAESYATKWEKKPTVLLNTRSRIPEKSLPDKLGQELIHGLKKYFVVLQLNKTDSIFSGMERLPTSESIRMTSAILKRLHCVVTVDSFLGHLAQAVNTPAIVIFGPSNPKAFGHKTNKNIRTSQCPPCADTHRRKDCKRPLCMEEIPVEFILDAVLSMATEWRI